MIRTVTVYSKHAANDVKLVHAGSIWISNVLKIFPSQTQLSRLFPSCGGYRSLFEVVKTRNTNEEKKEKAYTGHFLHVSNEMVF